MPQVRSSFPKATLAARSDGIPPLSKASRPQRTELLAWARRGRIVGPMRSRTLSTCLAGALLGCATLASTAQAIAQEAPATPTNGFALQRFTAAPAGDHFFGVSSPHASGEATLHVALLMD